MAQDMADELRGMKVTTILNSPDVFARALEIISAQLPSRLIESGPFWSALDTTGRALLREANEDEFDLGQFSTDDIADF